jgi:hypothetical protein
MKKEVFIMDKKDKIISTILLAVFSVIALDDIKVRIDRAYIRGRTDQLNEDTELISKLNASKNKKVES